MNAVGNEKLGRQRIDGYAALERVDEGRVQVDEGIARRRFIVVMEVGDRGVRSFDGNDLGARSEALYGAWLAGSVLGAVGMGLHHKLCHTLGGSFGLPHAETHAVVLPHAIAYNAAYALDALARAAHALGVADARDVPGALFDLGATVGAPQSLAAIGMPATGLDEAADIAVRNPYPNPRPLERDAIRALLQAAFDGKRPER